MNSRAPLPTPPCFISSPLLLARPPETPLSTYTATCPRYPYCRWHPTSLVRPYLPRRLTATWIAVVRMYSYKETRLVVHFPAQNHGTLYCPVHSTHSLTHSLGLQPLLSLHVCILCSIWFCIRGVLFIFTVAIVSRGYAHAGFRGRRLQLCRETVYIFGCDLILGYQVRCWVHGLGGGGARCIAIIKLDYMFVAISSISRFRFLTLVSLGYPSASVRPPSPPTSQST